MFALTSVAFLSALYFDFLAPSSAFKLQTMPLPAETIRNAVEKVAFFRNASRGNEALDQALRWVKSFQSRRFAATYADLLDSADFGAASRFFLVELYGDRDYAERDAQFARIAGTLQKYFPDSVVATAVALAQLHALTEELDFEMAKASLTLDAKNAMDESERYLKCWRLIERAEDRNQQLEAVLNVGAELNRLTQIRGLRMMLRMMRGPAKAAGLHALQQFLESGFDTFSDMSNRRNLAIDFLGTIGQREHVWIAKFFESPISSCVTELQERMNT